MSLTRILVTKHETIANNFEHSRMRMGWSPGTTLYEKQLKPQVVRVERDINSMLHNNYINYFRSKVKKCMLATNLM